MSFTTISTFFNFILSQAFLESFGTVFSGLFSESLGTVFSGLFSVPSGHLYYSKSIGDTQRASFLRPQWVVSFLDVFDTFGIKSFLTSFVCIRYYFCSILQIAQLSPRPRDHQSSSPSRSYHTKYQIYSRFYGTDQPV